MKKSIKNKVRSIPSAWGYFAFFTLFICSVSLAHEKNVLENYLKSDKFNYAEAPVSDLGEPLLLWATNYHLPEFQDGSGDVPLRDEEGKELGPKLALADWCKSALEGSVRIVFKDGSARTYNYFTATELFPNDCSTFYPFNLSKTKFRLAKGPYGDGVARFRLNPYRTLATDPIVIPTGSILFIPEARGTLIVLANGETIIHDGYFLAGDIGGAIKLNHVDVFIGTHDDSSFFPWIRHSSTLTFKAYIVKDQEIIDSLTLLHRR